MRITRVLMRVCVCVFFYAVPYSSWFEHSREWLDLLSSNTNILLVLFEDMHKVRVCRNHLSSPGPE